MTDWDLAFNTLFDIVSTSTGIDRKNVDFDTDRMSHRQRKYCEVRWDLVPQIEEPEEDIVDEVAVLTGRHEFSITYLFVSDRHVSRAELAQVSAHRLIVATATSEVTDLLASVGMSIREWSSVVDGPDMVTDNRRLSTATLTGLYTFSFCEPLTDLGLTDPGYFNRVQVKDIAQRIVSPGATTDPFAWQHLWSGGGATDLVSGWHFETGQAGVDFNVNEEISLSAGAGVAELNSLDVGQVLDGFSFVVAATVGGADGLIVDRWAGGIGWRIAKLGTDVLVTVNAEAPVVVPNAGGVVAIALGGVGQDVRVVGPGVDTTVVLASERRVITALSLYGGTTTTIPLMGFSATDPETLRNHVLTVLAP